MTRPLAPGEGHGAPPLPAPPLAAPFLVAVSS